MKYLTLKSSVFVFLKKENVMFYNSETGAKFIFQCTEELKNIVLQFLDISNMYSIPLKETYSFDTNCWIHGILENGYAFISQDNNVHSIPPYLTLSSQCERNISRYLHSVVINCGCYVENDYYKQFLYPIYCDVDIEENLLMGFLQKMIRYGVEKLTFVLDSFKNRRYLFNILDMIRGKFEVSFVLSSVSYEEIYKTYLYDFNILLMFENANQYLIRDKRLDELTNIKYGIVVEDVVNIQADTSKVEFYPFFNGSNKVFFKDYVCMNHIDLENLNVSKREIFRNKSINPLFFGQIYILPSGEICGDPNFPIIGSISDKMELILERVMNENYAWKLVRTKYPCIDCVYQWLCPPISSYELVLNTPLCFNSVGL